MKNPITKWIDSRVAEEVDKIKEDLLAEAAQITDDPRIKWTSLLSNTTIQSFTSLDLATRNTKALAYYHMSPTGHRICELTASFTVGKVPPSYSSPDPKTQELLDNLASINKFSLNLLPWMRVYSIYGMLALIIKFNPVNGEVYLEYIPQESIKEVRNDATNKPSKIIISVRDEAGKPVDRAYDIIRDVNTIPKSENLCIYMKTNTTPEDPYGYSDLLPVFDWLDKYDRLLDATVDRAKAISQIINVITYPAAAKPETIKKLVNDVTADKSAKTIAVSEGTTVEPKNVNLTAAAGTEHLAALLRHISRASAFNATWLSEGDNVNRATAESMEPATLRILTARRGELISFLQLIGEIAIKLAVSKKYLKTKNTLFTIEAEDILETDSTTITQSMNDVATSIEKMITLNIINTEEARSILNTVTSKLGVNIENDT